VFYDIDTIPPGVPWRKAIEKTISECDVMLPLIGLHWLDVTDEQGRRRLDLPNEILRFEIAAALRRETRIIPIQLHGARMPDADELPDEIADLTEYQAMRMDDDWRADLSKLIRALEQIRSEKAALPGREGVEPAKPEPAPQVPLVDSMVGPSVRRVVRRPRHEAPKAPPRRDLGPAPERRPRRPRSAATFP
jgi:hypothetical protein